MKEIKNPIISAISLEIGGLGFTRKSNNWTRASAEVSQVINLQKSNYGRQYYINLGFLPKEMTQDAGAYAHPRHEKCPIRLRIDDILPNPAHEIAETLDLEKEIFTPDDRAKRVREFMVCIAPTLDRLLTIEGLRRAYAEGTFRRALIMLRAKALLGGLE